MLQLRQPSLGTKLNKGKGNRSTGGELNKNNSKRSEKEALIPVLDRIFPSAEQINSKHVKNFNFVRKQTAGGHNAQRQLIQQLDLIDK